MSAQKCGRCGRTIGAGPKLVYMHRVDGNLEELRVCPFCFLEIVEGVKP